MSLKTTTAGWFPKSTALKKARWLFSEEEIDASKLREAEELATRQTLELQEELGLSVSVDGQMERSDLVGHMAENLEGMGDSLLVRCWGNRYYRRPRIEEAIERTGSITAPHFKTASGMTRRKLKAVVTGPYTLMDWSFDEHYGSREDCCRAFAGVVRSEVEDLIAAGATEIQIDEPAISARPDELALAAETLGQVVQPAAGTARTWARLGYGDLLPVWDAVVALPVDGLYLEMANSRFAILDRLGSWPADKLLTAGVLDVASPEVESTDELKSRIERLLAVIPAGQLSVGPDAALRSLTTRQAQAKLKNLVEAASHF